MLSRDADSRLVRLHAASGVLHIQIVRHAVALCACCWPFAAVSCRLTDPRRSRSIERHSGLMVYEDCQTSSNLGISSGPREMSAWTRTPHRLHLRDGAPSVGRVTKRGQDLGSSLDAHWLHLALEPWAIYRSPICRPLVVMGNSYSKAAWHLRDGCTGDIASVEGIMRLEAHFPVS